MRVLRWWSRLRCALRLHPFGRSQIVTETEPRYGFQRVVVRKACQSCPELRLEGVLSDFVGPARGRTRAEKRRMEKRLDAS